jgi:hypothetical protein
MHSQITTKPNLEDSREISELDFQRFFLNLNFRFERSHVKTFLAWVSEKTSKFRYIFTFFCLKLNFEFFEMVFGKKSF